MNAQARTRVGIIGAGNIATIAQLPTLVKRDDVELAALVSRRPDPGPLMRRWGFRAANAGERMRLGPPVAWQPARQFGLFNLFWG